MIPLFFGISSSKAMQIEPTGGYDFFQSFSEDNWTANWVFTTKKNYSGKWTVKETGAPQGYEGEKMLFMKDGPNYFAASHPFENPFKFENETFVIQYELRYQDSHECAGGYLKLFSNENYVPQEVTNETRYSIMFGADKCANTNKVHFIIRYKDKKTGIISEKHMKNSPQITVDKISHLYTLIIRPNNTFAMHIDGSVARQGSLMEEFEQSFSPPQTIPDANDTMPADWVKDRQIPDPSETKPDDWNETEPEFIPDPAQINVPEGWLVNESVQIQDPNASMPADWDEDIMGNWDAPLIQNPKCIKSTGCGPYSPPLIKNEKYKGIWKAKMIDNPDYKGEWKPKDIPNPDYYNETNVFGSIMPLYGLGFENWVVDKNVGFGNVWIGHNESAVIEWNKAHFIPKHISQDAGAEGDDKKRPGEIVARSFSISQTISDFYLYFMESYEKAYKDHKTPVVIVTVIAILVPTLLIGFPIVSFVFRFIWKQIRQPVMKYYQQAKTKIFGHDKKKKEGKNQKKKSKKD